MSKGFGIYLMLLTLYYIVLALISNSLLLDSTTVIIDLPSNFEFSLAFFGSLLVLFFNLFTFQVEGVSPLITLIFFWVPSLPIFIGFIRLIIGAIASILGRVI